MAPTTSRPRPPPSTADRARRSVGERLPRLSTPCCDPVRLVLRRPVESGRYAAEPYRRHRQVGGRWIVCGREAGYQPGMTPSTPPSYAGHRFPPEVISHAVWLYFRFPLGLRMVEEMLAARGITVSHETVRQWALKFGQGFANEIRRRLPRPGDKWHLDEVQIRIAGEKHWLWRAVDQDGTVLDVLVQSRRDKRAAKRLLRKLLKRQGRAPRVLVTDKLASYPAAKQELMPG